ncbi:MAG: hypothetical protein J1F37_03475 [Oscillospiraceae bacterium]|nr:hypothetical protein [Oscillospiraceae bacterium]
MKTTGIYFLVFLFGAGVYPIIEITTRGYTHWSMMLTGGAAFLSFYIINKHTANISKFIKSFYGMFSVTALELTVGLIVNKFFNMNVWDYSGMKFNLFGQISLAFSACWYMISFISFCILDIADFILSELKFSIQQRRGLALEQK